LGRADLREADLSQTDLRGADLSFARLLGADLRGVQVNAASRFRAAKLVGARIDRLSPEWTAVLERDGAALPVPQAVAPVMSSSSPCLAVAWNRIGDLIASSHGDGSVQLWDATSGQMIRTLRGHRGPVRGVAFNPLGTLIATCSDDTTVALWDVVTGR